MPKLRKMQPTPSDVHYVRPLTNISIMYVQEEATFVADKIFPNVPVLKQSDRYWTYDRGHFWRDEFRERAPGAESAGSGYSVDNTPTYYCTTYAFHHDIPDEVRANTDAPLDADRDATIYVTQKALIKREKSWTTKYFTTTVWGTDVDGVAAAPGAGETLQWNDANSNPIRDVRVAKTTIHEETGYVPNTLAMSQHVWDALIDHPDIVDRIKYGQTAGSPAMSTLNYLSQIFGIERIFVFGAVQNTAAEGAANAFSFIAGKHALLCYSAPRAGIMTPTAGLTFSWTGFLGATPLGYRIEKFRLRRNKSDRIEADMSFDQKVVCPELGYFFNGIVA